MDHENSEYKDRYVKMGLKIQYYRKLKGYTQEDLAALIDRSWSFIAQIEAPSSATGFSFETLFKISEVLGIEPYQILKND